MPQKSVNIKRAASEPPPAKEYLHVSGCSPNRSLGKDRPGSPDFGPLAYRPCSPPPRRLRYAPPIPEPSSVYDILRQHSRSRLYLVPLHWTSISCSFWTLILYRGGGHAGQDRNPASCLIVKTRLEMPSIQPSRFCLLLTVPRSSAKKYKACYFLTASTMPGKHIYESSIYTLHC